MPGLLEIDCEHYAGDWEEAPEIPMGVHPWLRGLEAHETLESIKTRRVVSITEWLEQTARLTEALPASLEERFREQADKWRRETEHLSSPAQMMMHPSYQAILGLAQGHEQEIIRLMLCDLRDNRTLWFWALSYLTKDNPIQPSQAGKLDKMINAWINWGRLKGIL